jgi:hypothetical protein
MSNVDQGRNQDLHGNALDGSRNVLLLVDVVISRGMKSSW